MQWVVLVMGLLAVFAPTVVEGSGGKGKEAKGAFVEIVLSAAFLEIGRAIWNTGKSLAAKGADVPQKGNFVWAVWGSPVQRRAIPPSVQPAVIMDVRVPVGLGAGGSTVLVRWFDGSSAWTNVDFVNVFYRTHGVDSDDIALAILFPERYEEQGEGSAVDLNLFTEVEAVEQELAAEVVRREEAESDSAVWHDRMEDAEESLADSQVEVTALKLQLLTATNQLAVNAIAAAGPTLTEASTQVEERVFTEASTQVDVEPVVVAADARAAHANPSSQEGDTSTPRKRSKTIVYTPHDTIGGRGGGAKHWKPAPDGSAGGGSAAGGAAT